MGFFHVTWHRVPVTWHRVRSRLASRFGQSEHRSGRPELRSARPGNLFGHPGTAFFELEMVSRRLATRSGNLATRSWTWKRVKNCLASRSGAPGIAFATLEHCEGTLETCRVSLGHRSAPIKHPAASLGLASAANKHAPGSAKLHRASLGPCFGARTRRHVSSSGRASSESIFRFRKRACAKERRSPGRRRGIAGAEPTADLETIFGNGYSCTKKLRMIAAVQMRFARLAAASFPG